MDEKKIANPNLAKISMYNFENFLNMYRDEDSTDYYNLLRTINVLFETDNTIVDTYFTTPIDTWYLIAHKYYGVMDLWWLVLVANPDLNPCQLLDAGTKITLIKPEYVNSVVDEIIRLIKN